MAFLDISGFTYTYPLCDKPALKDINLQISEGEFVAIIGANGSGKSSLCYGISGFLKHLFRGEYQGSISMAGKQVEKCSLAEWVKSVGLVFQNPFTQLSGSKFTVFEEIAFGLENFGVPRSEMMARINSVLELTGISDLADRSPYSLSGGQQQRVALASILVLEPMVLVLDEPTSQLDPIGSREVFQAIKDMSGQGRTVIIAEHKIEWVAQFADRVIVLHDGQIILEGSPHEVLTSEILPNLGVNITRYTSLGRAASCQGLWPENRKLPVVLQDAVEGFQEKLNGY